MIRLRPWGIGLHIVLVIPAILLALLLIVIAETAGGRCFGLAALLVFDASCVVWTLRWRWGRLLLSAAVGEIILAMVFLGVSYRLSPTGGDSDTDFRSVRSASVPLRRFSPANLVPEVDQLKLGLYVMPPLDPFIDGEQARRVRRVFGEVYEAMRKDADFKDVDSALGLCYGDIITGKAQPGHFFEYVPGRSRSATPRPAIIFLHGSMGNFKGYTWVLKSVADALDMVIVAPSYGLGNWRKDPAAGVVGGVIAHCEQSEYIDAEQLILAGLSNGGLGVTRALAAFPDAWMGAILISAVVESHAVPEMADVLSKKETALLVLHGNQDRRIPIDYVEHWLGELTNPRIRVKHTFIPDADHFMFFSHREQCGDAIRAWLQDLVPRPGSKGM